MHETEAVGKAYDFIKFEKKKIICNSNDYLPKEVFGYVSKFGALNFGFKTFATADKIPSCPAPEI